MSGLYESLFRRVLYPAYESGLRRRKTLRYLDEYERNQWLPPERIAALQWEKLQRLLRHCWEHVPYYRRRWADVGATLGDIRSLADFARLPSLTKDDIRSNFGDLIARDRRSHLLTKTTGGSTGQPLRFGYDHDNYERRTAVMWRGYGWAGMAMGRRAAYLWGTSPAAGARLLALKSKAFDVALNRRIFDAFAMREDNLHEYADGIARFAPRAVVGYVRPLYELSKWMNANGFDRCRPRSVITGAEALRVHERREIESAFGCPVFDTYGCRELMLIASECEARDGLHMNSDHLVVEIESPQPDSGLGEVVATDLHNYTMPFVRYRNGDLACAFPESGVCTCGRGLPKLQRVDGRVLDALRTRDGRIVPGEFFPHLLKDFAEVLSFRVVQRSLDALELQYVANEGLARDRVESLRAAVTNVFGPDLDLQLTRVGTIAATPSGKRRVTISELSIGGTTP